MRKEIAVLIAVILSVNMASATTIYGFVCNYNSELVSDVNINVYNTTDINAIWAGLTYPGYPVVTPVTYATTDKDGRYSVDVELPFQGTIYVPKQIVNTENVEVGWAIVDSNGVNFPYANVVVRTTKVIPYDGNGDGIIDDSELKNAAQDTLNNGLDEEGFMQVVGNWGGQAKLFARFILALF